MSAYLECIYTVPTYSYHLVSLKWKEAHNYFQSEASRDTSAPWDQLSKLL